jgi:very-short-patch-repair endonuclease
MLCPLLLQKGWVYRLAWHDHWGGIELDFALIDKKLNVELDGSEHAITRVRKLDEVRDAELTRRGWKILRIPNADVDESPEKVARKILRWAKTA